MGLANTGFFLGAGTSLVAGFPLSEDLTKKVIDGLNESEVNKIKELLEIEKISYEPEHSLPDIEIILDILFKHVISKPTIELTSLQDSIKKNILNIFRSIKNPKLDIHIKFLKSLKNLIGTKSQVIYIFTTNYDLVIEKAAQIAKIPVYNGFIGSLYRYFDIEKLKLINGTINSKRFVAYPELRINLIKLHGSISWYKSNASIYEIGDYYNISADNCSMILPRRQKLRETLEKPYDSLFSFASKIIGSSSCKYLISSGFSLRDQHINDYLITPNLKQAKIKFYALFKDNPTHIKDFTQYKAFNYISEEDSLLNGQRNNEKSTLWDFSYFVNELAEKAGI